MYTLGYPFRPWDSDTAIADGASILDYLQDTARVYGIDRKVRFHHRVTRADWRPEEHRWQVEAERTDTGATVEFTCSFLFACTGYYRYDEGYTPAFQGAERFKGQIVHPQFWSPDVEYEGKRVIVIGSGATAVTLVPAVAEKAEHVTMLQRSPSYMMSLPREDPLAGAARRLLSPSRAYALVRWKNALLMTLIFQLSRRRPELMKKLIRKGVQRALPPGYDVEKHFTPRYNPWEQRMCLVPDADLFEYVADGRASIVTDEIESFTERGIRLASGGELEADLIVTATGLNLLLLGGTKLSIAGQEVSPPDTMIYRGCMLSDVPNFAFVFGYTNASWTLRCDLSCQYVSRVLAHMDEHGYASCVPRNHDRSLTTEPFADFSSGYIVRSIRDFPRQGSKAPWRLNQNYLLDVMSLKRRPVDDTALEFSPDGLAAASSAAASGQVAAAA
jgi:cation diffusion facilitator CzcD-associated flavoprotein CzcO